MYQGADQQNSDEHYRAAMGWLLEQLRAAPESLRPALDDLLADLGTQPSRAKAERLWKQLGRAMGILRSSEKRRSSRPTGVSRGGSRKRPQTERERLEQKIDDAEKAIDRYAALDNKFRGRRDALQLKLKRLPEDTKKAVEPEIDINTPIAEIQVSEETQQATRRKVSETVQRLKQGDGPDPSLAPAAEALMHAPVVSTGEEYIVAPAELPANFSEDDVVKTIYQERKRVEFSVSVTELTIDVEKKVVADAKGKRRVISGSTQKYGPKRYGVTWSSLATLAVLVGQFAMPLNRLANLISTPFKRFTTASLGRMLHYVAKRFLPVYFVLVDQLSDADILAGDDTSSRVVEIGRHFSQPESNKRRKKPWLDYATIEAAQESFRKTVEAKQLLLKKRRDGDPEAKKTTIPEPSLCVEIGRELTFESPRRDGKGAKRSFNTTVVTGRSVPLDPLSMIVLYRSHIGSFGDLLEMLLRRRRRKAMEVIVQADLATTNLVTDPELLKRFNISMAGCGAHSRRPFALYEHEDPVDAPLVLSLFRSISGHERALDAVGRNRENVLAIRADDSRPLWNEIKEIVSEMKAKWSRSTPLGAGCRYILRHFDKLTAYLKIPALDWTNNLRERLLRPEKLIEKNSLFRQTVEGRAVLDIIRTIVQTASAAKVPVQEYLIGVLMADPEAISADPESFTPLAWAKRQKQQEQDIAA